MRLMRVLATVVLAVLLAMPQVGCSNNQSRRPRATRAEVPQRDVHPALRGTLGAQASITGDASVLVSGIGLVVGLDGTGGQILNEQVAATLEREMALRGVGTPGAFPGTLFENRSPREVLLDRNVAAVVVQAAIPPGSQPGHTFDVFVRALNASSLDGGRLMTTDLSLGSAVTFGGPQTRIMGEASGDLFINPFSTDEDGIAISSRTGRILNGGTLAEELNIRVIPDTASHSRVRVIISAINTRFPRLPGERREVAVGRGGGSPENGAPVFEGQINVRVPERYRERPDRFVNILRHLQIDTTNSAAYARQYAATMRSEPALASAMAWALEGLGEPALDFLRPLYESDELVPRLASLRAGVGLGDPRAVPPLLEIAKGGPAVPLGLRIDAIRELGEIQTGRGINPRIDATLAELLADDRLTLRVASYEALAKRAERVQRRRLAALSADPAAANVRALTADQIEALASVNLPAGTFQRVSRVPVAGKFLLDRVPVGDPLIYVSQQGVPRIVLFGERLEMERPLLVEGRGGRLTMISESPTDAVRVLYRRRDPSGDGDVLIQERLGSTLVELIDTLAHNPASRRPGAAIRPGFAMSYSEVVGVLSDLHREGVGGFAFATERDRLIAEIIAESDAEPVIRRPLSPDDRSEVVIFDRRAIRAVEETSEESPNEGGLVVPIPRQSDDE